MGESISLIVGIVIGFATSQGSEWFVAWVRARFNWPAPEPAPPAAETVRFTEPRLTIYDPENYDEPPRCPHDRGHTLKPGDAFYVWSVPANEVLGTPEGEMAVCEPHAFNGLEVPRG